MNVGAPVRAPALSTPPGLRPIGQFSRCPDFPNVNILCLVTLVTGRTSGQSRFVLYVGLLLVTTDTCAVHRRLIAGRSMVEGGLVWWRPHCFVTFDTWGGCTSRMLPIVTRPARTVATQRLLMEGVVEDRGGPVHSLMTFPTGGGLVIRFIQMVAGRADFLALNGSGF